jgi:pimeloyl-ACP methyl ester carboxylesterase
MLAVQKGLVSPRDGPDIAWAQSGAGADVVLIHGALTTLDDMVLGLFPALAPAARVTAFDRPGHGGSGKVGPTGSPWRQAEALHAAAVELELQRPVIVGQSFGGAVALAYALRFPAETRGVVAVAPIVLPELRLEHLLFAPRGLPGGGPMLNALMNASLDPALLPTLRRAMFLPQAMPEGYAERFPFQTADSARQMAAEGEDALALNLGLVRSLMGYWASRTPMEIFIGDRDKVVNPLHAQALVRQLRHARLTVLPGLGHMAHHFAPQPIADAALRLAGSPPQPAQPADRVAEAAP